MSESESNNSLRSITESIYRDKASSVLSHMYDKTKTIAEQNSGKNRGIASGAAASVFEVGLERLGRERSPEVMSDDMWDSDGPPSRGSQSSSVDEHSGHFVDRFLEKLLQHAIPTDSPQKADLVRRLKDPDRAKRPNLSIKILASNFKQLSSRMSGFFVFQYGAVHILTWRKPSKTLTFLIAYTCVCMWPHFILAYPLLYLLFGVIIPGYLHRHPIQTTELIQVKKRGQSLLSFFTDSEDMSIIHDYFDDNYGNESDSESLRPISSKSSDSSAQVFSQKPLTPSKIAEKAQIVDAEKKDKARHIKSQMTLLMNMRDLQNLTTDMLVGYDKAEDFWYDTAGFKDEKVSTVICYLVILAIFVVLFFGQYIPWRFIFIQSGWAILILCHPVSKKYITKAKGSNNKPKKPTVKKDNKPKQPSQKSKAERNDIIVDESPEIKIVEIFELQAKSLSGNDWKFECYSGNIFGLKDSTRLAQKKPEGTDHLSKVLPPSEWKFDMEYKNHWTIDRVPLEYLELRYPHPHLFRVEEDEKDGWIYDSASDYDSDTTYQFRRRRLTRECYRYHRPIKRPSRS